MVREENERQRQENEQGRESADSERGSNEAERIANEQARELAESERPRNSEVVVISSEQTKPIAETGEALLEYDTGKVFFYDGTEWIEWREFV